MSARAEPAGKIPATVITGFLGAGKTSTVRHILEEARGRRIALIINEFGELGIDGEILRGCGIAGCVEEDVLELANGCICCTVAEDFLPTMRRLLERPNPPQHIVIETSGLALPKPLVRAFNWPEINTRITVDGVVTLVDAPAVAAGLFAADPEALAAARAADPDLGHESPLEELFEEQLGCADLVVLNKSDLLDAERLAGVERQLRPQLRPGVGLLKAAHGRIDPAVLLGIGAAAESDLASRPSHHEGEDDHDHDDFVSFAYELGEVEAPAALAARVGEAVRRHGLLRVKGFAAVAGKPMRLVLQGVGPRLHHYFDRDWRPQERRVTRLVVIAARGLDPQAVGAALGASQSA